MFNYLNKMLKINVKTKYIEQNETEHPGEGVPFLNNML